MNNNFNALVFTLGQARPGHACFFDVEGNENTLAYVYSMLKVLGVKVLYLKGSEFQVIVPENKSFVSPDSVEGYMAFLSSNTNGDIKKYMVFLNAHAKGNADINPLILRDKLWDLIIKSRDFSEDDWKSWENENDHEWESLEDVEVSVKSLNIKKEKSTNNKKAKAKKAVIPSYLMAVGYLVLAVATAFYIQAENAYGMAGQSFYDARFLVLMLNSPAVWLDMIGGIITSILPGSIGQWVFWLLLLMIALKGIKNFFSIFKKSDKSKKANKAEHFMYLAVIALPTFLVKLWLWVNFFLFCFN